MTGQLALGADVRPTPVVHSTRALVFFAAGTPRPKGSFKAVMMGNRPGLRGDSSKEPGWRAIVTAAAKDAMKAAGVAPLQGCVEVLLEFFDQRPKGHFRTNGQVKADAQLRPTKAPDADKLMRSVGDALNGVCWRDDAQVCEATIRKLYTTEAQPFVGVRVTVRPFVGA